MSGLLKSALSLRFWLALVFIFFQFWILVYPTAPLVERPTHLVLALALVFIGIPLKSDKLPSYVTKAIDLMLVAAVAGVAWYYWHEFGRLETRMDNVSRVYPIDIAAGIALVLLLLESVRRTVGWILVSVLVAFLAYGAFAYLLPWGLGFSGFKLTQYIEILSMNTSGILGVTTATSVNFVFYFIAFGVVYSAVGGGQLFIDLAVRMVGTARGGSSKVAIVASSLMGMISGAAVAIVAATGVFTTPLMRRTGIPGNRAAATVAIASTGGQLMPPVMGIAAFVMAELLAVPYSQIALAGLIPAVAFYLALIVGVDLHARRTGQGTLKAEDIKDIQPLMPRLHLLAPPIVLIAMLVAGYSAQLAVTYSTLSCFVVALVTRDGRASMLKLSNIVRKTGQQAAEVAVPISAIGMVIAVAIQSNMALKFSSGLIVAGGGTIAGSLILIVIGCIIMGMGLPTVAAYIIGAILYVPALQALGVPDLAAHFFVFYYCVLSMVTPPVALASFAAAGLAGTSAMKTGLIAFQMSFVAFLIPFAFVVDEALLFQGDLFHILFACVGLLASTTIWAIGLVGYAARPLKGGDRLLLMVSGAAAIVSPTGTLAWWLGIGVAIAFLLINWRVPQFSIGLPAIHFPKLAGKDRTGDVS